MIIADSKIMSNPSAELLNVPCYSFRMWIPN